MKTIEQTIAETPSLQAADNYSVRERHWRAPAVGEDEEIIFDEPGRVLDRESRNGVDCRSHYFRVTKPKFGRYMLRVRHGAGEESCSLKHDKRIIDGLALMDSDTRYRVLYVILDVKSDAEISTREKVNAKWQSAAAEKRIRTRKVRNSNGVKVWIEPTKAIETSLEVGF